MDWNGAVERWGRMEKLIVITRVCNRVKKDTMIPRRFGRVLKLRCQESTIFATETLLIICEVYTRLEQL